MAELTSIACDHVCKSCGYHRKLKLLEPCSDCFHNQKFNPISGVGKCCWVGKSEGGDTTGKI